MYRVFSQKLTPIADRLFKNIYKSDKQKQNLLNSFAKNCDKISFCK